MQDGSPSQTYSVQGISDTHVRGKTKSLAIIPGSRCLLGTPDLTPADFWLKEYLKFPVCRTSLFIIMLELVIAISRDLSRVQSHSGLSLAFEQH